MSTDLRLVLPNRPGTLLRACQALASGGVVLEGVCGDIRPGERWGYLHLLVNDAGAARAALERIGLEVAAEHDVELSSVDGGQDAILAAISRYTDEERNVEVLYMCQDGRLVVGTEDMRKAVPGVKMRDARY
jgi:hypothetical protein